MSWRPWARHQAARWRAALKAATTYSRTPAPPPPYHVRLLAAAYEQFDAATEEKYQFAVVLAQAACEVLTDQVLDQLIEKIQPSDARPWVRKKVGRTADLDDDRLREFYEAISGDRIGEAAFWADYKRHVKRRHGVVHAGVAVSRDDAAHSYEAARKLVDHLTTIQAGLS